MPATPLRVLVVDDADDHADLVRDMVRFAGAWPDAAVDTAASYAAALAALERATYDLAFCDYWLGAEDGLALIRTIRDRGIHTPVIVLTGRGAEEIAVEAMKAGAADYLSKSNLSVEAVTRAVRQALAIRAGQEQRQRAEAALRASEERFRALVENSLEVLLLLDRDGRITYSTPSAERHFGWRPADMTGAPLLDLLHAEDRKLLSQRFGRALARPGEQTMTEARFRHADGTYRSMDGIIVNRLDEPAVRSVVFNARGVTEGRRLEEQLRQAQKMEAVGRLAGGVAHDFNNLLTAILGYCNLALEDLSPHDPTRHDLEEIRAAGERAAALTWQLLAFSRRQMLKPEPVDLNALIRQLERSVRRLVGDDVELVMALGDNLPPIKVDPASLDQIIANLAANAHDAMPDGGRLVIETAIAELDASYADSHATVTPGPYVMLSVTDTGEGMDAPTRARIFEPFFTTKAQRRGSGLGLAAVYGIVKQTGGYIWVYSEPAHGTVFKVYLPLVDPGSASAKVAVPTPRPAAVETILLVEDEDAVRSLTSDVLTRWGYAVLEAAHGLDALKMAESHQAPIDLLLTDIEMPYMNGRDLAEKLVTLRPLTKVLFMSAHADHAAAHRELIDGAPFLQKPFTSDVLVRKVRSLLDAAQPS